MNKLLGPMLKDQVYSKCTTVDGYHIIHKHNTSLRAEVWEKASKSL